MIFSSCVSQLVARKTLRILVNVLHMFGELLFYIRSQMTEKFVLEITAFARIH
jgi:hypothetical protein